MVLPLSVADNSAFSSNRLTVLSTLFILPYYNGSFPSPNFKRRGFLMTLHVFLLLLLCVLMFSLARLCSLCWPHHGPAQSAAATRRTPLQRLLKPRSPHDCV
jgi:hypothetical protein